MAFSVDLFWSFRSPYSYLAIPQLRARADRYDFTIRIRPVRPLALRNPDRLAANGERWVSYVIRDVIRLAEYLDIPLGLPNPDPVIIDPATGRAGPDQSRVIRLTRLAVAAEAAGLGFAFLDSAARLIWSGQPWLEGDELARAVAVEGVHLPALEAQVDADPVACDRVIEANEEALLAAGHWGVPTMVFEGEPFFGQDRIDLLLWRMRQKGLAPRSGG